MNEMINNPEEQKKMLKHLIEHLHQGQAPEEVKKNLIRLLQHIPYEHVVEVEQQLIAEGISEEEILQFCDLHTAVLEGSIDLSGAKEAPIGHPVDVFKHENRALKERTEQLKAEFTRWKDLPEEQTEAYLLHLRQLFNELSDVDKHYLRKEYLLFPFLEKAGITGPPKVMWGKHDETRALLKAAHEALTRADSGQTLGTLVSSVLLPAVLAVEGMIMKEEEILLPMALDTLTEEQWKQIDAETSIYGFCLYDPPVQWQPESVTSAGDSEKSSSSFLPGEAIRLSSGSFSMEELESLFLMLPVDITFVDKNDKVKFFSHSPKRVFERNRAVIGRDVRMCHPPQSVHMVERIISDFKSGRENKAAFWMSNFQGGRFVYIEYTALRSSTGEYLGIIETTQDITALRNLQGDQRLLAYSPSEGEEK